MVVCNSFDIYMFTLSRTACWCQYLINLAFLSFFWGCQKSALIAILRLLVVASLLILGYDATASSNSVTITKNNTDYKGSLVSTYILWRQSDRDRIRPTLSICTGSYLIMPCLFSIWYASFIFGSWDNTWLQPYNNSMHFRCTLSDIWLPMYCFNIISKKCCNEMIHNNYFLHYCIWKPQNTNTFSLQ